MGTAQVPEKATAPATTSQGLEAIARSLADGFNGRTLERAADALADDCEWTEIASGTVFRGKSGYINFQSSWIRGFSDGKVEILNVLTEGNLVVTEYIGRGTNDGLLTTATGQSIGPTGKRVELRLIDVMQFKNGKISRARTYYDALTLLTQLGAMKNP